MRDVLSLPIHCTAIGCTTLGQLEDDVLSAREFKAFTAKEMVQIQPTAPLKRLNILGPNWPRTLPRSGEAATCCRRAVPAGGERRKQALHALRFTLRTHNAGIGFSHSAKLFEAGAAFGTAILIQRHTISILRGTASEPQNLREN